MIQLLPHLTFHAIFIAYSLEAVYTDHMSAVPLGIMYMQHLISCVSLSVTESKLRHIKWIVCSEDVKGVFKCVKIMMDKLDSKDKALLFVDCFAWTVSELRCLHSASLSKQTRLSKQPEWLQYWNTLVKPDVVLNMPYIFPVIAFFFLALFFRQHLKSPKQRRGKSKDVCGRCRWETEMLSVSLANTFTTLCMFLVFCIHQPLSLGAREDSYPWSFCALLLEHIMFLLSFPVVFLES